MDQLLQIEFFHPAFVAPHFAENVFGVCAQSAVQHVATCKYKEFV
jgi:hypothetical protein